MTLFEFIGLVSLSCFTAFGLYNFVRMAARDGAKDALNETMPWSVHWDENKIGEIVHTKEKDATPMQ